MNSADFFLLYLHLANHKTINNSPAYLKGLNACKIRDGLLLEQGSTKKAFCLLAFAGLHKTIAVTEWRNPFGRTGFYNQIVSNNNFSQIMGKLKTLTGLKSSIASNSCYDHALVGSPPAPMVQAAGLHHTISYLSVDKARTAVFNKPAFEIKLQETSIISSRKLRNKFNTQILSQSFKANYLSHLVNCNGRNFLEVNTQKQFFDSFTDLTLIEGREVKQPFCDKAGSLSRKDHRISLIPWASMAYFSGRPASINQVGQGTNSNTLVANVNSHGEGTGRQLDELLMIPPLLPVVHTLPTVKPYSAPALGEGQALFLSPERVQTRARKTVLPRREFCLENPSRTFRQSLSAIKKYPEHLGLVSTEKNSIKFFFDCAKENSLLASADLTRFYTAAWLLESIRAELLLRNSNIKRVLNQVFLLTQQPLYNSSKKLALSQIGYGAIKEKEGAKLVAQRPLVLPFGNNEAENALSGSPLKESLTKATVIPALIKGLRITLSGRMGGRKGMAKTLTKTAGRVPSSTLREKVDFAKGVVQTKTGSLGIKVWICHN